MSFRLPIITNTIGAVGDLVKEHDLGLFFKDSEIDEVISRIENLVKSKDRYKEVCNNVEKFYLMNHSRDTVFKKFDECLP